jgi:ABC-2 type transport system ATP-binding protein
MSKKIALEIKNLYKTYKDGKVKALGGVNLTIYKGEIFGLLGPNGAGKSTLINVLTTLANKTSGEIVINGLDFAKFPSEAKTYLGVVPQEFNFNWFEKVEDIVVQQAGFYGMPAKEAKDRAEILLKRLGLWDKKDTVSMKLSGGMKRRLMIVRALIHKPEILILDEPSAGVDVDLRREMWEFVRELNQEGVTIILTTHYLEEAENLCDRVGIINKGNILEVGTVKELLSELKKDTLVLDIVGEAKNLPARYRVIEEGKLETDLLQGEDLYDITNELHKKGLQVTGIRNKTNRLEEVFINKVSQ